MNSHWSSVPLHKILSKSDEVVSLKPDERYQEVTVRLWGKGVTQRRVAMGAEIAASSRTVVRAQQFIVSRIDARNGAFGLVPEELDGAVVSNDFPVFKINTSLVCPSFLEWMSKTKGFVDICKAASEGTTNRVRLKEDRFLAMQVSLPSPKEQQRIVRRIEELSVKIEDARGLRREAARTASTLYETTRDELYREINCKRERVAELFNLINGRAFKPYEWGTAGRKIIRIQNLKYPSAAYNYYNGYIEEKHLVEKGDVLFAWSGQVVSLGAHIWTQEQAILNQHIFNVKAKREMLPRFVQEGFNALIDEMKTQVRGLEMFHIRKQEIDKLLFPVPSISDQHLIVDELNVMQARVNTLKRLQAETAEELNALLPSVLDKAFKGEL